MNSDSALRNAHTSVKCARCGVLRPQESFPRKARGNGHIKTCHKCTTYSANYRQGKKENQGPSTPSPSAHGPPRLYPSLQDAVSWSSLLEKLAPAKTKPCSVDVILALTEDDTVVAGEKLRTERAALVVDAIQRGTGYQFNQHEAVKLRKKGDPGPCTATEFEYFCAQREGKQTKPKKYTELLSEQRDRDYMTRFRCGGCLRVTINDLDKLHIRIKFTHDTSHIPYTSIALPDRAKEIVKENKDLSPALLWKKIIDEGHAENITEKQVYNLWLAENEGDWRLDADQILSAKKVVERAAEGQEIELVALRDEDGMAAIAFALKKPLKEWGGKTAEIAFDGTFNTNAAGYELSALVAEGNGMGIPIGFILTTGTDGTAKTGAKKRLLVDFLEYFKQRCPHIQFTLTDKEKAEIDAFREVWPEAKHNCCYWHAVRYVEMRLAEDKAPAAYNPREAARLFTFIDPTWAPGVVADEESALNELGSGSARTKTTKEMVEDLEEEREAIRLTCRKPAIIIIQGNKRTPIWPNPPPVVKKELPRFCPKEHRTIVVEKFRRHFCQHPLIPLDTKDGLRFGTFLTSDEIHYGAVKDMYTYCRDNQLNQVWAYMWNCWYAPEKWVLWARAASPLISRLRTTMIVESLWKHLKHGTLAQFARPRLDLLIHLIITDVLPSINHKVDFLLNRVRSGRPIPLDRAPWLKAFKAQWADFSRCDAVRHGILQNRLLNADPKTAKDKATRNQRLEWLREELEREPGEYMTSVTDWTCSCPSYLLSRFLTCKHLVREVNEAKGTPDHGLRFFKQIRRSHQPPFICIPGIHDDGTVSEGDGNDDDDDTEDDRDVSPNLPDADSESPEEPDEGLAAALAASISVPYHGTGPSIGDEGLAEHADGTYEDGAGRVHYSQAQADAFSAGFDFIYQRYITNPNGMHPKVKRRLDDVMAGMTSFVADVQEVERQRKRRRTWEEPVKHMYLHD